MALALLLGLRSVAADTSREIADRALPATVAIFVQDREGAPIGLGSGFFVRPGVVATNFHVIEGAASGYARIAGTEDRWKIRGATALSPRHDLALLAVDDGNATAHLPLGDWDAVGVGDPIYVVGSPVGMEGTFSSGLVSAIREISGPRELLLQITAPTSPGSSGGPVLNDAGEVIGVTVGGHARGENLNFAVPVSYLADLLERQSPPRPLRGVSGSKVVSTLRELGGTHPPRAVAFSGRITQIARRQHWETKARYWAVSWKIKATNIPRAIAAVRFALVFYDAFNRKVGAIALEEDQKIRPGASVGGWFPLALNHRLAGHLRNHKNRKRVEVEALDIVWAAEEE